MFQFTTTNVLNSLKDLTTGKDLIVTQKLNKEGVLEDLKDEIIIKRIGIYGRFSADDVFQIQDSVDRHFEPYHVWNIFCQQTLQLIFRKCK